MHADNLVKLMLALSLTLLAVALWRKDALPPPASLAEPLFHFPDQRPLVAAPFQRTVGGIDYTITPLYEYDLYGMVVSEHDAESWWDWIHAAWGDKLNVVDLCVVWGDNARNGSYQGMRFTSGEFVCYFQGKSESQAEAFDIYQLSNNHLLTDDPAIARRLRSARIGDQVHFRGYLAEYGHHHGFDFHRGTSTTRYDTGNGACETVYVTDMQILRSNGRMWRILAWVGLLGIVACIVTWFMLPATVNNDPD